MSGLPSIELGIELTLSLEGEDRDYIMQDLPRWMAYREKCDAIPEAFFADMYRESPEFRTIVKYRYSRLGEQLNKKSLLDRYYSASAGMPSWGYVDSLYIACHDIGPGFYVEHGFSTIIYAEKIGRNFWVNQNVTIGLGRGGTPTIGDNVDVRTHAVIIGRVQIGSNVKIGAGAVVITDVPENSTVVPQKSRIITRNAVRSEITLAEANARTEAVQIVLAAVLASQRWRGLDRQKFRSLISEASRLVPNTGPLSVQHEVLLAESRKVLNRRSDGP